MIRITSIILLFFGCLFSVQGSRNVINADSHLPTYKGGNEIKKSAGYHIIDEHMYYINTEFTMSWVHASDLCNYLGMKLFSLETEAKTESIMSYLTSKNLTQNYWTSGVRVNDIWYWTGIGHRIIYTNWGSGQPNNSENELCLTVFKSYNMEWVDHPCTMDTVYYTLCE